MHTILRLSIAGRDDGKGLIERCRPGLRERQATDRIGNRNPQDRRADFGTERTPENMEM